MGDTIQSPFPRDVSFVVVDETDGAASIDQNDLAMLNATASAKRKQDFGLGRLAARRALAGLGQPSDIAIPRGPGREPLWPPGITGSISHSGSLAIAAVGKSPPYRGLGVDVQEMRETVEQGLAQRIAGAGELEWINQYADRVHERVLLTFAAKEAIFKALFPVVRVSFGFRDAELSAIGPNEFIATARPFRDEKEFSCSVRWANSQKYIICGAIFT